VRRRAERPLATTGELAALIEEAVPRPPRPQRIHPATRCFMALRIAVNGELENLAQALEAMPQALSPGGRAVVISFHSLEDRLVKNAFRRQAASCLCPPGLPECRCQAQPTMRVLTPRPVRPGAEECAANPRARSARLRVAERL